MFVRNSHVIPIHIVMCELKSVRRPLRLCVIPRFKDCTSPIKLFKTKADVRQHVKNWHTLEKCEQRELKLLKKLEKYRRFADQYKKLKDQNKTLLEENRRLKSFVEGTEMPSMVTTVPTDIPKKPIPAFTQFLREQYALMKNEKQKKVPFVECSKLAAKKWYELSEEQKQPYIVHSNS